MKQLASFSFGSDYTTITFNSRIPMGQPKRKQSKQRSRKRRGANQLAAPQLAKDPTDGTPFRPHRVNPANGMYRGRQVLDVSV